MGALRIKPIELIPLNHLYKMWFQLKVLYTKVRFNDAGHRYVGVQRRTQLAELLVHVGHLFALLPQPPYVFAVWSACGSLNLWMKTL